MSIADEITDRPLVEKTLGYAIDDATWEWWQRDPEHRARIVRNTNRYRATDPSLSTDCIHRGDETREEVCKTCSGNHRAKVHPCSIHGECTLFSKPIEGVKQCPCPDQKLREKPFRRNLIYYLYPRKDNGMWQWNVEQLMQRIDQFDGRKVVAIAHDVRCSPVEDVKAAFGGKIDEFIVHYNAAPKGEVELFTALLSRVWSHDPDEITFYAHGKGCSRSGGMREYAKRWGAAMYETCLDYSLLVDEQLSRFSVTGSFKTHGSCGLPLTGDFHYSGTFFWFRNKDVFSGNWSGVGKHYGGTEFWVGVMFPRKQGGCLFYDNAHTAGLYHLPSWDRLTPLLNQWRENNVRWINRSDALPDGRGQGQGGATNQTDTQPK